MEIRKNRYGVERVYEKISHDRIRVMGESMFARGSQDDEGKQIMYDFEGGPCLNVGGKVYYGKSEWKIESITVEETSHKNLSSVLLNVKL